MSLAFRDTASVLVALALVSVCVGAESKGPFLVPRDTVVQRVKTIGVMPLNVAEVVPDPEDVAARYEAQVVTSLQAAGFSVVPPSAMREIRERLKNTIGGLYDPMTGKPIKDKVKAYKDFADSEYRSKHPVDATLYMAVVTRDAPMRDGSASWDGITDSAGLSWAGLLGAHLSGTAPALSLGVLLEDAAGDTLYSNGGGLQVISYTTPGMTRFGLMVPRVHHIDAKYIMTDPKRDARALAIALGPLLGTSDPVAKAKIDLPPTAVPPEVAALRVQREELLLKYRKVALAPLEIPELAQHSKAEERYRPAIETKLELLGFTVVGGKTYGELWERERTSAGGFFDPFTGRRDDARLQAARARVFKQMQEQYGISAIVFPSIVIRTAQFSNGLATWDGVNESITHNKGLVRFLDRSSAASGELSALSLEVTIADAAGATLFEESGGIHVMERVSGAALVPVPEPELFSELTTDTRAVDIAFAPLVK